MSNEHRLGPSDIHHDWDASRAPAVRIRPDDVVHFDLPITRRGPGRRDVDDHAVLAAVRRIAHQHSLLVIT